MDRGAWQGGSPPLEVQLMPKVGSKHFSYTKAGYAAAKAEAKKTGKKVVTKKKGKK